MRSPLRRSPEFDFKFQPETYWPELPTERTVLSRVQGTVRRELAERLLEGEPPPPGGDIDFVLDERIDDEAALRMWGRVHPQMLGGEFLPAYLPGEVEIARIEMRSTTGDVIQIRARPLDGRIAYRVVDEYETEHGDPNTWAYVIEPAATHKPLALGELIDLIDTARLTGCIAHDDERYDIGLIEGTLNANLDGDAELESMRDFFTVSSPFYPELGRYYDAVMQHWYDEQKSALEGEDE